MQWLLKGRNVEGLRIFFEETEAKSERSTELPLPESCNSVRSSWLGLLSSFFDHRSDSIQFFLRQPRAFKTEQRVNDILHGAVVERVDELLERGSAHLVLRYGIAYAEFNVEWCRREEKRLRRKEAA